MNRQIEFFLTLLMLSTVSFGGERPCTPKDEKALNRAFSDLALDQKGQRIPTRWWEKLEQAFQQHLSGSNCDDGYLGEGASEAIVKLMARDWENARHLLDRMQKIPRFSDFIIHHIDATTDWTDLDKITESASQKCPPDKKVLCERIANTAIAASKEAKSVVDSSNQGDRIAPHDRGR